MSLTKVNELDDPDLADFMNELRTNVLNCYSTVIGAAKESGL